MRYYDECDKYDYLIAAGIGGVAGIIDVFLVGSPQNSKLMSWTDKQIDNCIMSFAKMARCEFKDGRVDLAIDRLGKKFPVNYDQVRDKLIPGMTPTNHHIKNLAHSPSPVGLVFSIIAQFTGKAAFVSNGKLVTVNTETMELQGGNFIAKLFCGVVNWLGHLVSDMAGSPSSRRKGNRGIGIVAPWYELLQFVGKDKEGFNNLAVKLFNKGYDFRFTQTTKIPLIIGDLLTRFAWAVRRYFEYKQPLKECIPIETHDSLRIMLLVSNGTLCVIDGVDATARGIMTKNPVEFFSHLNFSAWLSFAARVITEIVVRCKDKSKNDINSDYYIDEESREIFFEASSSWKGIIKESVINSHIEGFWDCHKIKYDSKANRHLALAIVLATSEGKDTQEMINLYFSNGGTAEYLVKIFTIGWYCSPDRKMANRYRSGTPKYKVVEVVRDELYDDTLTVGEIVKISDNCFKYLVKNGTLRNITNNYDAQKDWEITDLNDKQFKIKKNVSGREISAWVSKSSCTVDEEGAKLREYLSSLLAIGTVVSISKKCLSFLRKKGIIPNTYDGNIQYDWIIKEYNETQYRIEKNVGGRKITAWVNHNNCLV